MIYGVILAGGRGERFWPLSRAKRPKQLLKLISDKTMLQETIDRILPLIPIERILIVTSDDMTDLILKEIKSLKPENILAEPMGRNTCLAIGLAAEHLKKKDPDAVMVVLSADHIIKPPEKLINLIKAGAKIAEGNDKLITIGIEPTRAETGYGYIKIAAEREKVDGISIFNVDSFTEKPIPAVANEYYHGRKHLWNSGMFIWSVNSVLNAINSCQPDMSDLLQTYSRNIGDDDEIESRKTLYDRSDPISIDFAVLENAQNVLVLRGDILWDDVGSWNALERYKHKDQDNNVVIGQAKVVNSYETTIYNEDGGIIVSLGISDLVIVKTEGIVLVAHKTQVNEVKRVIAELAQNDDLKKFL
ncbi:MAG: mannose-1-phosphate guanylyltransferase [Candidatus Zixiibacteriota bacterium]